MPASLQFSESNGAGETIQDGISNVNFGSNDSYDLNTATYPVIRGANSFSKYIRGKFTGTWSVISNMKFWKSSGAYVTDEAINAGFNATFATPSQTSTGDSLIPDSEPSQNVNSFEGDATIVYGGSGVSGYTGYIRLQLATSGSTPTGAVNQKEFTLQWDEV